MKKKKIFITLLRTKERGDLIRVILIFAVPFLLYAVQFLILPLFGVAPRNKDDSGMTLLIHLWLPASLALVIFITRSFVNLAAADAFYALLVSIYNGRGLYRIGTYTKTEVNMQYHVAYAISMAIAVAVYAFLLQSAIVFITESLTRIRQQLGSFKNSIKPAGNSDGPRLSGRRGK